MQRGLSKILVMIAICWIVILTKKILSDAYHRNISSILRRERGALSRWNEIVAPLRHSLIQIFHSDQSTEHGTSQSLGAGADDEKFTRPSAIEYGLRVAHKQIEEMWYYMQSKGKRSESRISIVNNLRKRKNAALVELELLQLSRREVADRELETLREFVKKNLHRLQKPANCQEARKLLCGLGAKCGFSCQLHHLAICFTLAIGTRRTLILDSGNWAYSRNPWEAVFSPISSCVAKSEDAVLWTRNLTEKDLETFQLIKVEKLEWDAIPPYLPLRVPKYLFKRLTQYHGDPPAWWMGQLVSYLIRPQPWLTMKLTEAERRIGFENPIAGVHVRRTDKVPREAAFHDISEYMVHVDDWFDKESMKRERLGETSLERRRVYIASDDPMVFDEAAKRYPKYDFLGDKSIAQIANAAGRYSLNGVIGFITDVTLLSKCDFFVGTFSSGMSRLVYEMMQVHHTDPTNMARSLDDLYYYVEQFDRKQRNLYNHISENSDEIDVVAGDMIAVTGNHWDGYSLGRNIRTNKQGLYPSYKTEDIVTTAEFELL